MIADTVERFGQRPLIEGVPASQALTYRVVWDWAGYAGQRLSRVGVTTGERVVIRAPKSVESLIAYLAALRLGAVWVPVAPGATAAELNHVIDDAEPRVIVDGAQAVSDLVGERPHDAKLTSPTAQPEVPTAQPSLDGTDVAAMLYTSGTTGRPKGVPITGGALTANIEALVEAWGFTEDDALVHALPTHHAHGLFVALGCALVSGASMRWIDRFDATRVVEALDGATALMGVPTHYVRLLDDPGFDRDACASLRLLTSGSAPLPAVTFDAIAERTGIEVVERYGTTETLMLTSNPVNGPRKPASVGLPLPGVEIRLGPIGGGGQHDPAGGNPAAGEAISGAEVGMVEVRGPSVFGNYWGRSSHAGDRTEGGWFRTGDLGRLDEDGYLFLVGRSKDLIISGGLNVYPAEVEAVLERHPGVIEVAVIGLPDDEWGQRVSAVVVPADQNRSFDELSRELLDAARAELSGYKIPRRVYRSEALPRNAMGKVDKAALRNIAALG